MKAIKIDGLAYVKNFTAQLSKQILSSKTRYKLPQQSFPRLALIQVGDNPASASYIKRKKKYASKSLIKSRLFKIDVPDITSQNQVLNKVKQTIQKLNKNQKYSGIILQLPIHKKIFGYQNQLLNMIDWNKDVDCLGEVRKNIFSRQGVDCTIKPCVVDATLNIFNKYKIQYKKDNKIVIIGNGKLAGMPLYQCLSKINKNIKIYDKTADQHQILSQISTSQIIITATGQPNNIKAQQLKKGCIIIDIGISPNPQKPGQVRGDFSQDVKKQACRVYTPVPKGIGPMVVSSLLHNTYKLWLQKILQQKN